VTGASFNVIAQLFKPTVAVPAQSGDTVVVYPCGPPTDTAYVVPALTATDTGPSSPSVTVNLVDGWVIVIVKSLGVAVPNFALLTVNEMARLRELALGAVGVVCPAHEAAEDTASAAASRQRTPEERDRKALSAKKDTGRRTKPPGRLHRMLDLGGCQRTFVSGRRPYCRVVR
jgi:hypothetical protein